MEARLLEHFHGYFPLYIVSFLRRQFFTFFSLVEMCSLLLVPLSIFPVMSRDISNFTKE